VAEAKPFASLSSGLLARKGAARPAMRPQGFGQGGATLEDLGWDDMGFEPPKPAEAPRDETHDGFGEDVVEQPRVHPTGLTPVDSPVHPTGLTPVDSPVHPTGLTPTDSPVHRQRAEIADRFAADEDGEDEIDDTAELYEAAAEPFEPESEPEPALVPTRVSAAPIAAQAAAPAPRRAPAPRAAPGAKGKAAFTLRLDRGRHLKLRLACAVDGRSAQQLVTDALDQLLNHMPELDAMAEKAKRKG
jgi:hypothetical protein